MSFLRRLFGEKGGEEPQYVICPNCGAGYNTERVMASILMKSPFMADLASWRTKIVCSMCRSEFWVSGSYNKVFGQPRPK
jgi:uncharacterized protein with PIN domain